MTNLTIKAMTVRARLMVDRWRSKPHNTDRVNRAAGRLERIIARRCAQVGEPLPTLYVSQAPRKLQQIAGEATTQLWLTTWPGNRVARLTVTGTSPAFGGRLTCYGCVVEGRYYYGRGLGPGMYINMRPGRKVKS